MKTGNAIAVPLFGKLAVVMRYYDKPYTKTERQPMTEEKLQTLKKKRASQAAERKKAQKVAEQTQIKNDTEEMAEVAKRNNAGLRHISMFINLIEYAEAQGLPVMLSVMTKRLTEDNAKKEWKTIRDWLGKNAPAVCAVSIGKRPKGWWVLRWVVVGSSPGDCYDAAGPFHTYLRKKGWATAALSGDDDAGKLRDHYLTRYEDDEETFSLYVPEMYEVYRAGLAMPETKRTYRSNGANEVVLGRVLQVADAAAYVVNGTDSRFTSPSRRALCEVTVNKKGVVVGSDWVCAPEVSEDDFEGEPVSFDDDGSEF